MNGVYDRWIFNTGEDKGKPNPRTWGVGWRYRVRAFDPAIGRQRDRTWPDGQKRKALDFAAAQETRKNEGRMVSVKAGEERIRTYGPKYVASRRVEESTRERYGVAMREQIIPHLGGVRLVDATTTTIQQWVTTLEHDGHAARTIKLAYELVGAMFKAAIRDRALGFTPCEKIRVPKPPDVDYWVPDHRQVHQLAAAIEPRYLAAVYIGGGCGLRRGETWALDVDSIDFSQKVIKVRTQVVRMKGVSMPVIKSVKTEAGRRDVPMPDHVAAAIKAHIAAGYVQSVQVQDRTVKVRKGQPYATRTRRMLFATSAGKLLWSSSWAKVWSRARAQVDGMSEEFTFHGLRHYFASALARGGSGPKRVAKLCGHASEVVTLRIYTHLWPDDDQETLRILNDAFAAGAEQVPQPLAHTVYLPQTTGDASPVVT